MICGPTVFAYSAPCAPQMGGIKAILIANPDAVKLNSMSDSAGTCTLAPVTVGAKPFYRWEVAPGQSTLNAEAQISEANGVRYFATDLVAALNGFVPTSAGANLLKRLHRVAVIVELKNGSSVFLGLVRNSANGDDNGKLTRGMEVTGITWTPGQAVGDAVRASVTMHLDSELAPLSVSLYSALVNS